MNIAKYFWLSIGDVINNTKQFEKSIKMGRFTKK